MIFKILIIIFFFNAILFAQNRDIENYKKKIFYSNKKSIKYRILEPYYVEKNPVPLFIFLHGSGERGDDNELQLIHGSEFFLKETEKKEYNSYVIFPQCPKNNRWSYHKKDPWTKEKNLFLDTERSISNYGNLVVELIQNLINEKNIDKDRIYISGLSMGGYGTFDLVSHHPELFAAAAPICGGADLELLNNAKKIPFWIFHGNEDRVVPVKHSRDAYQLLKTFSNQNIYTEYKGVGHNAWEYVFKEKKYFEWFFEKIR